MGITPAAAKKSPTPNEAVGILIAGTASWEEQLAAITVVKQSNLPNTEKARAFRVAMQNKFSDVHQAAAEGLVGLKADALAVLVDALNAPLAYVPSLAAETLGKIGPPAAPATRALLMAADTKAWGISAAAYEALIAIGPAALQEMVRSLPSAEKEKKIFILRVIGHMGASARPAGPAVLNQLMDRRAAVRSQAAATLGLIRSYRPEVIQSLLKIVVDDRENKQVRTRAARALASIGAPAAGYLGIVIRSAPLYLRKVAVKICLSMGPEAKDAVDALIAVVDKKNEDGDLRLLAIRALMRMGPAAKSAIGVLIRELEVNDTSDGHNAVSKALLAMGTAAVPALVQAMDSHSWPIRRSAAFILGEIGSPAAGAVAKLVASLGVPDLQLRTTSLEALGKMGIAAKAALPAVAAFISPEHPDTLRSAAHEALRKMSNQLVENRRALNEKSFPRVMRDLRYSRAELAKFLNQPEVQRTYSDLGRCLLQLNFEYQSRKILQFGRWLSRLHQFWWWWLLEIWVFFNAASILLYLFRPLYFTESIFFMEKWLRRQTPSWVAEMAQGLLRTTIAAYALAQAPYAAGHWLRKHLASSQQSFLNSQEVSQHPIYISTNPLSLNGGEPRRLLITDFRKALVKPGARLMVLGEGGAGKTALATQVSKWALHLGGELFPRPVLPLFLNHQAAWDHSEEALLLSARRELGLVTGNPDFSDRLLITLLRSGQLLLVVDRYSELQPKTQAKFKQLMVNTKLYSRVLVTSRTAMEVPGLLFQTLICSDLAGERLIAFVQDYLLAIEKRGLFGDSEFFEACGRLAKIGGRRRITPQIAAAYADMMVAVKTNPLVGEMPASIPDLVLRTLLWLNQQVATPIMDGKVFLGIMKAMAWLCVKTYFVPGECELEQLLSRFAGVPNLNEKLTYVIERLGLLHYLDSAQNKVAFQSTTLAEYLAAFFTLEQLGSDALKWQHFFEEADNKMKNLPSVEGFLLAVHDAAWTWRKQAGIPELALGELESRVVAYLVNVEKEKRLPEIQQLIAKLEFPAIEDRIHAAVQLKNFGPEAHAAWPALQKAAADANWRVRLAAAEAMEKIQPGTPEAVNVVTSILNDQDMEGHLSAVHALSNFSSSAQRAVPSLIEALKQNVWSVKRAIIITLGNMGVRAKGVMPELIRCFSDPDAEIRSLAIKSAGSIAGSDPGVLAAMAECLDDEQPEVRQAAVETLGQLGMDATLALPKLLERLQDRSSGVRRMAAQALAAMGPKNPEIVAALVGILHDPDARVREAAIYALAALGPMAHAAVEPLANALQDPNPAIGTLAAEALGAIGPVAHAACPALITVMGAGNTAVRKAAANALARMGKISIPALLGALRDPNWEVRVLAAHALGQTRNSGETAVQALIQALKDQAEAVRRYAVLALGHMGSMASQAVPALIETLKDRDPEVRRTANAILKKIARENSEGRV
jgi:HEAT repeat protein